MTAPFLDTTPSPARGAGPGPELPESFRQRYPFAFDPFQEEAIRLILEGSSVIVSAPTGAGKTLIAEFAIFRALAGRRRIVYTTPLKALSNQKYADFCRQFGAELVGILTGDVKVNPGAPLLVMTTEILRNLFYARHPEEIGYVVLDECHYMGDEGRGTVWEEVIINCPRDVQLVALSATVSNIDEIAEWISQVHRPIKAIHHPTRPVPLQYLLLSQEGGILPVDGSQPGRPGFGGRIRGEPAPGRPPHGGPPRPRRRPASPGVVLPELQERGWLPAIYFIFSRSGCERALERFLEGGGSLLERGRRAEVEEVIAHTLRDYPSIVPESEVNSLIFAGLRAGAGVHHAGILPALKRLTEVLFERGLVRVVFATETMSLGIHMPAKSVVIQGLRKRTDVGFRFLTRNELTQMAGRAGRRGIDPEGKCLVALDAPEAADEAQNLLRGRPEPIESRFRIGYSSAALLIQKYPDPADIRRNIESSFGQFQNQKRIQALARERAGLLRRVAEGEGFAPTCCPLEEFLAYHERRLALEGERQRLRGPGRTRAQRRARERQAASAWGVEPWAEARQRIDALALELSRMPCHRCPQRTRWERQLKRARRLQEAIAGRERAQSQLGSTYWEQFLRVVEVLRDFGYLEDGHLLAEGRLIASLRHDNELLVARVAFSGLLEGLLPAELAAVLSCLVEEPRETETLFAKALLKAHPHLKRRTRSMEGLAQEVEEVQRRHQVGLPVSMHTTYFAAAYRWTAGEEDWLRVVERNYGGHEGDLIRAFRRLIDLCRQLLDSPEVPGSIQTNLLRAVEALDRGIVLESALI